jgi:hypothetical protein
VNRRVIPGDELAIVPDAFRLLNSHADSFGCGSLFTQLRVRCSILVQRG